MTMFTRDKAILANAEKALQEGICDPASEQLIKDLSRGYKKLVRQMGRLITMGDRMQEELQRSARTDSLTELYNRRYFMDLAKHEAARSVRYGTPFSICLLDADHFKQVNDSYGHEAGDKVLKALSDTLVHSVREMDVPARFGGEEFVVLLPATACSAAQIVAERIREAIAETVINFEGKKISCTVSVGVTSSTLTSGGLPKTEEDTEPSSPIPSLDQMLQHADVALYAAKKKGRNCVMSYTGYTSHQNVA